VLDEPSANLDDVGEAALVKTIRDLKKVGKTVFLVAHQRHLLALADRLIVMTNVQIAQVGTRNAGGVSGQSISVRGDS